MSKPFPMRFESEKELQLFMAQVLGAEDEVTDANRYRVDLVTDDFFIEVKPVLTPAAMDKAAGQLARYSPHAGDRTLVIAGLTPKNFDHNVVKQAESFRDANIGVWFVDQEPVFVDAYKRLAGAKKARSPTADRSDFSPVEYRAPEPSRDLTPAWIWLFCMAIAVIIVAFMEGDRSTATAERVEPEPIAAPAQAIRRGVAARVESDGSPIPLFNVERETVGAIAHGTPLEVLGTPSAEGYQRVRIDERIYFLWVGE